MPRKSLTPAAIEHFADERRDRDERILKAAGAFAEPVWAAVLAGGSMTDLRAMATDHLSEAIAEIDRKRPTREWTRDELEDRIKAWAPSREDAIRFSNAIGSVQAKADDAGYYFGLALGMLIGRGGRTR